MHIHINSDSLISGQPASIIEGVRGNIHIFVFPDLKTIDLKKNNDAKQNI